MFPRCLSDYACLFFHLLIPPPISPSVPYNFPLSQKSMFSSLFPTSFSRCFPPFPGAFSNQLICILNPVGGNPLESKGLVRSQLLFFAVGFWHEHCSHTRPHSQGRLRWLGRASSCCRESGLEAQGKGEEKRKRRRRPRRRRLCLSNSEL